MRSLNCFLVPVVAATSCRPGWVAWGETCYGLIGSATHRGCDAVCGEDATLACIQTKEENDFVIRALVMKKVKYAWMGQYQWPVDQGALVGWDKCTSGATANATLDTWDDHDDELWGEPGDHKGMTDCAAAKNTYNKKWFALPCYEEHPCLCATGASASLVSRTGPLLTLDGGRSERTSMGALRLQSLAKSLLARRYQVGMNVIRNIRPNVMYVRRR